LGGRRIARRDASGTVYYYFADHLGTNRVMTNATGTTQQESDYEPFGVERPLTNLVANKYKFTGKERDTETGNDHFWARNYSDTLGRWLSPDPDNAGAKAGSAESRIPETLRLFVRGLHQPGGKKESLASAGRRHQDASQVRHVNARKSRRV
jgi:RHS repeat-associated protein